MRRFVYLLSVMVCTAMTARAQGVIKDDFVRINTGGAVAQAKVRVCIPSDSLPPCPAAELATIYTTINLTTTAANPLTADGNGRYIFYAPPGRYRIQALRPPDGVTLIYDFKDAVLANDPIYAAGVNVRAFGGATDDWCTRVNAADTALTGTPARLLVDQGANATACIPRITLHQGHVLVFTQGGTYPFMGLDLSTSSGMIADVVGGSQVGSLQKEVVLSASRGSGYTRCSRPPR